MAKYLSVKSTIKITSHNCLYFVYSNDISLIVTLSLNNQKFLPRLRLMQQLLLSPLPQLQPFLPTASVLTQARVLRQSSPLINVRTYKHIDENEHENNQ